MKRSYLTLIAAALLLFVGTGVLRAQTNAYITRRAEPGCARIGAAFRELGGELVVLALAPGAPAALAGLQRGDRVREIDGAPANLPRLDTMVSTLHPGKAVEFRVQRGEEEHALNIVAAPGPCGPWAFQIAPRLDALAASLEHLEMRLGGTERALILQLDTARLRQETARLRLQEVGRALADSATARAIGWRAADHDITLFRPGATATFEVGSRSVAGVELSELNPDLARYFEGVSDGLLVLRVAPETPGARSGLVPGDVLVRAGGEPAPNIAALRAIVARAQGQPVALEVVRGGKKLKMQLR